MFFKKNGKTEESPATEQAKQRAADAIPNVKAASMSGRPESAAAQANRPASPTASGQPPMSEEARKRAAAALQLSAARPGL